MQEKALDKIDKEVCIKYTSEYFVCISSWLKQRDLPVPPMDETPKIGFIAFINGVETAIGFLRMVEGRYAQLDGLITNPSVPGLHRSKAIDIVVSKLLVTAKDLKLRGIISYSADPNTIERSKRHGFTVLDQYTMLGIIISKDQ